MSSDALDRLAEAHGIALSYVGVKGERVDVSDAAKRGLLAALGVPSDGDAATGAALAALPAPAHRHSSETPQARAFLPPWLDTSRVWGITCQLYGLRSGRNSGIGDFEDLAQLAELAARHGADFVGVNPLHALFLAAPGHFSPYSPSSRRFLNPLYVAVDRLEGVTPSDQTGLEAVREAELVDYPQVSALKRAAFSSAFAHFRHGHLGTGSHADQAFQSFRARQGSGLAGFALFEALSEHFAAQGLSAGWQGWPDAYKDNASPAVRAFRERHADRVEFHAWLQWVAADQLAEAQQRALAAGMRIGLYLDMAVGVATHGADTWCAPDKVLAGAHIGAPPDPFNANGQDWGLAPLSPEPMRKGRTDGLRTVLDAAMRHAGAVRLDHVMGLRRLYLIPQGRPSSDGAYVDYPIDTLLGVVAAASADGRTIVIGEDLGTVPHGFRDIMREADIQGYRVLFFEREHGGGFRPPDAYDRSALACVSTHDLPTLAGWWGGRDIAERARIGLLAPEAVDAALAERLGDRRALIAALNREGLLSAARLDLAHTGASLPDRLDDALAVATHRLVARTPCRLVAVQLEDLVGAEDSVNIPGTIAEHPNWRRTLPVALEGLGASGRFEAVCGAMSQERPRTP
jgi:4-alpha-glucanotransferase